MFQRLLLVGIGVLLSSFSLRAQDVDITKKSHEGDADYEIQRQSWIRGMHRAEPGLNTDAIDAEYREAKYQSLLQNQIGRSIRTFAATKDTVADGRMIGKWVEKGSNNVSGRMHTVDVDFDNNIIYGASAMGNVWKADFTDPSNWTSLNDNHRFGDIRMLRVVTSSKGKRIIAAASGPFMVHYSDDGGVNWKSATGLDGPQGWGGIRRAVMSADESHVYLFGTEWDYKNWRAVSTLYMSSDQGSTFTNLGQWDYNSDKCDVWTSRDTISPTFFLKGDSLFQIESSSKLDFVHSLTYADSINNVGSLLLQGTVRSARSILKVLESTNNLCTFVTSTNDGKSWSSGGEFSGGLFGTNSYKVWPHDPQVLAVGTVDAFVSRDGGSKDSWNRINSWGEYYGNVKEKLHADIDGIDFITDRTGNVLAFISTDGGVFMSSDDMFTFENITYSGVGTSQYYSVLTSTEPPYFVYCGSQDQGYQRAPDTSVGRLAMSQTISGDYGHLTSSNKGRSVWCDYPGFVMLYPNAKGGGTNPGWDFVGKNHLWLPPVTADPNDSASAYVASGGDADQSYIWRLTNKHVPKRGDSIITSHWSFDFSQGNSGRNVSAIAFSPIDHSHCYVLTNDGQFFDSLGVDGKWKRLDTVAPGSHYFYGSVILPSTLNLRKLWIAGSGYSNPGVYESSDEGKTFTPIDSGLPKTMIYGLAATENEQFLFAATEVGPFVYSVEARKWYDLSLGNAPDMVYWSVEYVPAMHLARFGTYGRGVWDFVVDQARNSVASDSVCVTAPTFNLSAKPSLFSTRTDISFELSEAGNITLRIYDITGKAVRTIVSDRLDSGWHHYDWKGTSDSGMLLPSGYYTCIAAGIGKVEFAKIDLVR